MSIIGGALQEFREDPLGLMCGLNAEQGDVARFRLGPKRFLSVFNPDMLKEVMITKSDAFEKGGAFGEVKRLTGDGLVLSEGALHKRQRRIIQPQFTRGNIQRYAEQMTDSTLAHVRTWSNGEERDLTNDLFEITFDIIARSMFSFDSRDQLDRIGRAFDSVNRIVAEKIRALVRVPLIIPTAQNREYVNALATLDEVVYGLIRERRAYDGPARLDLLSVLMSATDEADGTQMDDTQIRDELMTMFLAGHETTAHTLSWAFDYIMRHPEVEEKLTDEWQKVLGGRTPRADDYAALTYTQNVLWETLRLKPAIYLTTRTAVKPVTVGSIQLQKGDALMISPYPLHVNPAYFEEPLKFRPERFENDLVKSLPAMAYFPFGTGPRSCIGNHFAMLEMVLVLSCIGQRFRLRPAHENSSPPIEALLSLRPKGGVRVALEQRPSAVMV